MDAASDEDWPVRRLARVSGVSAAHFARSFKEAFGVPPHRYLLTRRIERATALLRDADLSITEIAFATGWQSLGTFGRAAHRPDLKIAVSEKRRQGATGENGSDGRRARAGAATRPASRIAAGTP